ncbi:MAG: PilT/PilU family type 4a pilus ATPase [Betaproteobacteria bacterium]|nr:PilT/PilU family type 4a pilus ATPase [Betaproteobacteria bacterium]
MFISPLLRLMAEKSASDLFFSAGAPINIKINGIAMAINQQALDGDAVKKISYEVMTPEQIQAFEANLEMNFSFQMPEVGNFRVNVFRQRGDIAMVIRYIKSVIPTVAELKLPLVLNDLIMEKRGLILVVGSTGSGKSTTLASMLEHRNSTRTGHILTVEDPIEFVFRHQKCIVNQREVGMDTLSYGNALTNAMREAPDVLMIGEIRDRDTLRHALIYAQTGHLCLSTLHANNSYHALNRIINFFPYEFRASLLSDLAISLKCVISQRLVRTVDGKLAPAVEVLTNTRHIAELIKDGQLDQIKDAMEQSLSPGSQTFEQALSRMWKAGLVTRDEALRNADSPTNLANLMDYGEQGAQAQAPEAPAAAAKPAGEKAATSFEGFTINTEMLEK